MDNNRQTYF